MGYLQILSRIRRNRRIRRSSRPPARRRDPAMPRRETGGAAGVLPPQSPASSKVEETGRETMMRAAFVAGLVALAVAAPATAQVTDDVVKIGVLTDMSSLYSDINGQGAVVATQMAI